MIKIKKQKAQKCVSSKGNFYMKIIKTLYKHLKLKVKYKRLKNKIKLMYILLRSKRIHKKWTNIKNQSKIQKRKAQFFYRGNSQDCFKF